MIEIGSVIPAKVVRVEPYGVYLEHGTETVIVLAPEVSWGDRRDIREQVHVGDTVSVLALRYNYEKKQVVGSIRRLHPEQNPYRQLARLDPETVLRGKVTAAYNDGVSVRLPNGARGTIPGHELKEGRFQPGAEVDVVIAAVEVDEGDLTLRPHKSAEKVAGQHPAPVLAETPR